MVYKLTGKLSCDYTQAYGYHFFDIRNERWDEKAADLIGVPLEKMPPLYQSSTEIVGELTSKAAAALGLAAGVPVIAGGFGCGCGRSLGAGVSHLGQTVSKADRREAWP